MQMVGHSQLLVPQKGVAFDMQGRNNSARSYNNNKRQEVFMGSKSRGLLDRRDPNNHRG